MALLAGQQHPEQAAPGAGDPSFRAAWVAALDELELDCARAEELLRSAEPGQPVPVRGAWSPPHLPGTLPPDLAGRARALLDRQLRTSTALTAAMHATARQAAVVGRFSGTAPSGPAYVDRAG